MIDFDLVRQKLCAWVAAGTGLSSGQVAWRDGKDRPAGTYVDVHVTGLDEITNDVLATELNVLVLADDVVESVSAAADTLTLTAHAYLTGDGAVRFTTTGTPPPPLAIATDYWLIKAGANTVKVARTFADAMHGVAIDITGAGAGTHTIVDVPGQTVRAGIEVRRTVGGPREIVVELQCFSTSPSGASWAGALLEALRTRAALPAQDDVLALAGLAYMRSEPVKVVDAVRNSTIFEPRAVLTCYLSATQSLEYLTTKIDRVRATVNGVPLVVPPD